MRSVPLTRTCPECHEDMELITADDVGEILVYECPECGYQEEIRVEPDEASLSDDDDVESLDPDEA